MEADTPNPSTFSFKRSELLIFGVVVLVLVAFVVPRFVKARREAMRKECIFDLKRLHLVADKWALTFHKSATNTYSLTDPNFLMFFRSSTLPVCPAGGSYKAGTNISDVPKCNIPGHTL